MMGDWTFFSNYGHVLVCLARDGEARLRDVAADVGITERAVQKIVRDLQDEGFLSVTKQGRCNRYRINRRRALRHQLESHCTVGKLLALVSRAGGGATAEGEGVEAERPAVAGVAGRPPKSGVPAAAAQHAAPDAGGEKATRGNRAEKKPKKKAPPVDTRQQGSLF